MTTNLLNQPLTDLSRMPAYTATRPDGFSWPVHGAGTAAMLRNAGCRIDPLQRIRLTDQRGEIVLDTVNVSISYDLADDSVALDTLPEEDDETAAVPPIGSVIYAPLTLPKLPEAAIDRMEAVMEHAPEIDRAWLEAKTVPELRKFAREVHKIKGARIMTREPLIAAILEAQDS